MSRDLFRVFITIFAINVVITVFFSYNFYHDDIIKYEKAYQNKIKLYPPTNAEIKKWEATTRALEIQQRKKEIMLLEANIPIPDDMGIDFPEYPDGHNPPKNVLQKLLNDAYKKRIQLYKSSIIISIVIGSMATFFCYLELRKKKG